MSARILCTALLRQATRRTAAALIEGQQALQFLPAAVSQSAQRFSTSSAPLKLAETLKDELEHEQSSYEKSEVIAGGPPAPFLLEQTPGDTLLTLKRKYKDEDVTVSVSDNLQDNFPAAEEEGAEYDTSAVSFNVSCARGGQALVFECVSDGTTLDITHVSCEPAEGLDSDTAYTGPVFQELDEALQSEFREFLMARGVNEDLGEYLRHLMYDKEQTEYMGWLARVGAFVGKQ